METSTLTILGKSDSTLPMIMDILESNNQFPNLNVINNLCLPIEHEVHNPKFNYLFSSGLTEKDKQFVLGVTQAKNKKTVFDFFKRGVEGFVTLIHTSSYITGTAVIGKGCIINANACVSNQAVLGDFVTLNLGCVVSHHVKLGDFVTLNPSVSIAGHSVVGNGTTIGIGASVIDSVKIGKNCIIGAGSLVNKDIPDNVVAYGTPCKIIRTNE